MVLKYKYVIGTHVMFYEIELFSEFVDSLINAIADIENKGNIYLDFCFNISEYFEKIDDTVSRIDLESKYSELLSKLSLPGLPLYANIYNNKNVPYTMTDYRRDLNYKYCNKVDYVIWGETDCLLPRKTFSILDEVKDICIDENIHKYITTFAVRKMWDDSWKILEHPEFIDKQYHEKDNPLCWTEPHSIRTVWNQQQLDVFNAQYEENPELLLSVNPKFDGSLLCISTDLIKEGCNIPPGIIGLSGEDTSFMISCMRLMGSQYRQIIVKNVLKIHNREHPKKRLYCKTPSGSISTQENKGKHYETIRMLSKKNLEIYQSGNQQKYLTWDNFK